MFPIKFLVSSSNIFLKSCRGKLVIPSNFLKIQSSTNTRNLFTNARLNVKLHFQTENTFGHEIMERERDKYNLAKKTIFPVSSISNAEFDKLLQEDWSDKKPDELITAFEKLSDYAHCNAFKIDDQQLDKFIDALADNMSEFNDDQLDSICRNLLKWPETESVAVRNYVEIWGSLDDAIMNKLSNWNIDKTLMFLDNIYNLFLIRKSDFVWKALLKANRKAMNLSTKQLVQSMFYFAAYRKSTKEIFEFEIRFSKIFDELSIDEIGVICMGFFKSKTQIRSEDVVSRMIHRVIEEADNIHEITLCSILKMIRYSSRYQHVPEIIQMLDLLAPKIPELSTYCCIQLALVTTKTNIVHKASLNAISQKFVDNPTSARLKDLERLTFILTEYKFQPETTIPIFDFIVDELRSPRRKEEIDAHGKCLLRTLSFLAIMEIYPVDLIHKGFDKDFLELNYGKSLKYEHRTKNSEDSIREIIVLKYSIDVELNEYNGNMVGRDICQALVNRFTDYVPEPGGKYGLNAAERYMLEVILLLQKMRNGNMYVHGDHLLPQFQRPDVVICNDVNNKPIEVAKYFSSKNFGTVQRAPDNVNKWFAFVFVGKFTMLANTRNLLGPTIMKVRQLKKIGYRPIVMTWSGWNDLRTEEMKMSYLNNIINKYDDEDNLCISTL